MKTIWKERENVTDVSDAQVEEVAKACDISLTMAKLLAKRGYSDAQAVDAFLQPDIENMHYPFELSDMDLAVDRLIEAREKNERICIYGDYDVDGTTAVSMLLKYFGMLGMDCVYRIPNRLEEGYGMNITALEEIAKEDVKLIVTVDTGISAFEEVDFLNEKGIDCIITDHHEWQGARPPALAVIDAKLPDHDYPFSELCGAGVALKLIQAMDIALDLYDSRLEYIEMAAMATIADIVPLVDENRIIASIGIESMNQGAINSGIRALIDISEVTTVTAGNIGFVVAPKMNAAGRLGDADAVVKLYTSDRPQTVYDMSVYLKAENEKRQQIEKEISDTAFEMAEQNRLYEKAFLIVWGDNWHSGVIGIVASRLQEHWHRPTIVIGIDEEGLGRGSCRSVPGVDIFEALQSCGEYFETFGGHEQAAGFSIRRENIEAMCEAMEAYGVEKEVYRFHTPQKVYDMTLDAKQADMNFVCELERCEPCGYGNPAAVFKIEIENPGDVRRIGREKTHLSFMQDELKCIAFGEGEKAVALSGGDAKALCRLKRNEFNGNVSVQAMITDLKTDPLMDNRYCWNLVEELKGCSEKELDELEIKQFDEKQLLPEREHYVKIFKSFSYENVTMMPFDRLRDSTPKMNSFQLIFSLNVLKECGLLKFKLSRGMLTAQNCKINEKRDIQKAPLVLKLKLTLKQQERI